MSQHSEKKIVINGAQCLPALYLKESFLGAFSVPLLLPCSCGSGPLAAGLRARAQLSHQHILAEAPNKGGRIDSGQRRGGGGRSGRTGSGRLFLARVKAYGGSGSPLKGSKTISLCGLGVFMNSSLMAQTVKNLPAVQETRV